MLAALLLVAAACAAQAGGKPPGAAKAGGTVKLELEIAKDRFLLGEQVPVTVRVVNTGAQDVDVPLLQSPQNEQPVYTLTSPAHAQGETFSARSAKWQEPGPIPPGQPKTSAVKAGDAMTSTIPLAQWRRLEAPGAYTLQARLEWNGVSAASNVVRFTVEASPYVSASLGIDQGAPGGPVRVAWLAQQGAGRGLGQTLLYEKRPDLGEVKSSGARQMRAVGPAATDPTIPVANFDRMQGLFGWHLWREGPALFALPIGADAPETFDLGAPSAALVRPALMAAPSGDLDQFVLGPGGAELRLVRFPFDAKSGEAKGPPSALWSLPLPAPARAAASALGPASAGSSRRVALVVQEPNALILTEVDAGDGSKAAAPRSVRIPGGKALAGSEPGVVVDEQGNTRVALVFGAGDPGGVRLALAEAVFPAPGQPGSPTVRARPAVTLEPTDKVAAAVAAWRVPGYGPPEARWVVALLSGEVLISAEDRLRFPSPPAHPLQLLSLRSFTYLLLLDPAKGPDLHALP